MGLLLIPMVWDTRFILQVLDFVLVIMEKILIVNLFQNTFRCIYFYS